MGDPPAARIDYARWVRAAALVLSILGLGLGWLGAIALAAPPSGHRVVLADPDPELRHAMEQALAPWYLDVVIEGPPPRDIRAARDRAEADTARFVVWREGTELVVFDRELETIERRDSQAGVLDPPAAAAAALTIKTMMRLPPPPPPEAAPSPPAPASPPSLALRLQLGVTGRLAHGDGVDTSARFGGAVLIRPWRAQGWRFGVAGDTGTSLHPSGGSFQGSWSEWVLVGVVGWGYEREHWEIGVHVGAGIRSSSLEGTEQGGNTPRSESAMLGTARIGGSVRLRAARWTLGLTIHGDETFSTPIYTKTTGNAVIYQVPDTGLELGVVTAVDL